MKVSDLKEICKLMSVGGIIDSINMKDNKISGINEGKTFMSVLEYNQSDIILQDINIENLFGIKDILSKFSDDVEITVDNNKLYMKENKTDYHIILKPAIKSPLNPPIFKEDDFDIIVNDIDHNTLQNLGKLRVNSMVNELYYLFIDHEDLKIRIGEETETHGTSIIEHAVKSKQGFIIKFSMNISECFKNIFTNANIYMMADRVMIIECKTERYTIKYYLAPRVDN